MKHELGVSVYPDLSSIEQIKDYLKLAAKYGFTRVFSSMFSVEGTKEEILAYFKDLIEACHEVNMKVALDVNEECFNKMGAKYNDLSVFADIHVDILRVDTSFGASRDVEMMHNPYGIIIECNSSSSNISKLIDAGANGNDFIVCHNFYPQRYTGLRWKKFLSINQQIKSYGNIRMAAFVSSQNENTHGVWNATNGLPTVEFMRDYPIDLQARILLATNQIDDILIGNAYASEEELKALSDVIKENDFKNHPMYQMAVQYGIIEKGQEVPERIIKIILDKDVAEIEKEVLFKYFPHVNMNEGSEWMLRMRMSRMVYNQNDKSIPPRNYSKEYFEVGDVLVVNDLYKHYCGEVQIVLQPMKNDGTRNLVGHLDEGEFFHLQMMNSLEILKFMEKEI